MLWFKYYFPVLFRNDSSLRARKRRSSLHLVTKIVQQFKDIITITNDYRSTMKLTWDCDGAELRRTPQHAGKNLRSTTRQIGRKAARTTEAMLNFALEQQSGAKIDRKNQVSQTTPAIFDYCRQKQILLRQATTTTRRQKIGWGITQPRNP